MAEGPNGLAKISVSACDVSGNFAAQLLSAASSEVGGNAVLRADRRRVEYGVARFVP